MKKITKIAATFAATMAILFGAASCSHDGGASLAALSLTDDDDEDGDPVTPVTVKAKFTMADNLGAGKPFGELTSETDKTDIEIIAEDGSEGATLKFSGTVNANSNNLRVGRSKSLSDFKSSKGVFTLELKGKAKVTVNCKSSSSTDQEARIVAIANSSGTALKEWVPENNTAESVEATCPAAGTYNIYVNGCDVIYIEASSSGL